VVGQRLSEPVLIDYSSLKEDFNKWIHMRVDSKTANCYINYLNKYLDGATIESIDDLIEICLTVNKGWNWFAKAVRNLINYCVERRIISKGWAAELKEILKLKKDGTDTFVPSDESVKEALKVNDDERIKLLLKLLLYSGIRITEAIKLLGEFDPNRLHFNGNVAYYDLDWKRGNKNSFKAFMPIELAKELKRIHLTENIIHKNLKGNLKLKHSRNWFINKMVELGVPESIIQFMIGHGNGTVLKTNYLEKLNNSVKFYKKALPILQNIIN